MKICIAINNIFQYIIEISFFHTLYSDYYLPLTSPEPPQHPPTQLHTYSLFSKQNFFIILNIKKNYHQFINSNFSYNFSNFL